MEKRRMLKLVRSGRKEVAGTLLACRDATKKQSTKKAEMNSFLIDSVRAEAWRWWMHRLGAGKLLSALAVLSISAFATVTSVHAAGGASIIPARIRALEGSATIQRDQEQCRVEATITSPLFAGDRID